MQFSFLGFSVKKIMEFNLDIKDMAILRYFDDFRKSGKMNYEIIDGRKYYWISYQNIENELPFLGLGKRAIMVRMLKMKKLGILEHYTKKEGGTFSFYALSEKFNELIYIGSKNNNMEKCNSGNENYKNSKHKEINKFEDKIANNKIEVSTNEEKYIREASIDNEDIDFNSDTINELEFILSGREKVEIKEELEYISEEIDENNAVSDLEVLIKDENLESKGVVLDAEGITLKEEPMKENLQKSVSLYENKQQNVQGVDLEINRGYAQECRTNTNILNNSNTIVNNIYNNIKDIVSDILNYLNKRVGVNYKATNTKTINLIKIRLKEGFSINDFKRVIDKKIEAWKGSSFEQYLTPFTLFGDKFEVYLNQKVVKQDTTRNNNFYGNKNYGQPKKLRFDNFKGRDYDYDKLEKQLLGWE